MEMFDSRELNARLREQVLDNVAWRIVAHERIPSTNLIIKEALEQGESEGLIAVALEQSAGYGRQGRTWKSPAGGLYLSLALTPHRPDSEVATLGLVTSLALKRALQMQDKNAPAPRWGSPAEDLAYPPVASENDVLIGASNNTLIGGNSSAYAGYYPHESLTSNLGSAHADAYLASAEPLVIKWPNDLLQAGKKRCGISLERTSQGVCLGIGINVFGKVASVDDLSFGQQTYLTELLMRVLSVFARCYAIWNHDGFPVFRDAYNQALYNRGEQVRLEDIYNHAIIQGEVYGVDDQGRLLLYQQDGSIVAASSGEVHTIHES